MKTQFTRRFLTAAIAAMLLASSYTVAQKVSEAEVQYRDALRKQQVEGDLDAAMKLYQNIIASKTADRPTRAKALLQLAACYESLGRKADALYQQVVQDFGDQPAAKQAAEKLAALRAGQGLVASRMLLRGSVDSGASVMPDGRLIMTDWSTGDVVIRDMTTGQIKRLMAKPESRQESRNSGESPLLSPDLRQVAYNWWDNSRRSLQLRVMPNESGGKPRVLIPNAEWEFNYFEPSGWSSDGKSILVNLWNRDGTKQIAWVSVADGTIRVLKSLEWRLREGRSRLSPDGRYVVYSAWEGSGLRNSAIHIVAADGSSENLLVKPGGFNGTPVWTPDGKHVVYLSDRKGSLGLWSVPVQDGKATDEPALVKADVGSIVPIGFTNAGSYYYLRSDDALDIFLADVDPASGNIRGHVAVTQKFVGSNLTPVWSPDGKFIVFNSRRQPGEEYPSDVVVYSIETGEERTYAMHLMRLAGNPMWFRDGKAVLQGMRDQQGRVFFYRVDLKTGEFKQVVATGGTSGSVESALSPDDKTVYTNVGIGSRGSAVIRAFDLATGQQKLVLAVDDPDPVKDGRIPGLGLSPDGRTLAFKVVYPEKRETHVGIVGIDGKGFRDLYTDAADQDRARPQLTWTKDGRTILFTRYSSNQEWQLMRIPAEGGKPEFTGLAGKGAAGIDLSPDGARIVFNDGTPGTPELWTLDNLPILKTAR